MKTILSPYKMLKGIVPSFSPFSSPTSPFSFPFLLLSCGFKKMENERKLQGEFPVVLGLNLKEAKLLPDSVTTLDPKRTSVREMGSLGNSVA